MNDLVPDGLSPGTLTTTTGSTQDTTIDSAPNVVPPQAENLAAAFSFGGSSSAPDEITPEITALTQGVINGPGTASAWQKCFLFATNQLEYEHYYGCKKGALLTYVEHRGNDADLATLLVAMLRSAGYTARYGYGVVAYTAAPDADGVSARDWLGCSGTGSALLTTLLNYTLQRGFPNFFTDNASTVAFHRVWVEINLNGSWTKLDPAVKKRVRVTPAVDAATASGYNRITLKSTAGGTITSTSIDGVDYNALSSYLTARATSLLSYFDSNNNAADSINLTGGWVQTPFILQGGQPLMLGSVLNAQPGSFDEPQQYTALPASLLSTVTLEVKSTASGTPQVAYYTMPMANLQGRRLSLTFTGTNSTSQAQLWLDDTLLAQESSAAVGTTVTLKYTVHHPHSSTQLGTYFHDQYSEKPYVRGSRYVLTYGFNPSQDLLRARQEQLDSYRRAGLSDTSREVVTETLNIIGLTWLHESELLLRMIAGKTNCDPVFHHRIGRVAQSSSYFIDVDLQYYGLFSLDNNNTLMLQAADTWNYFMSAMEHGSIEQLQGLTNPAVSTVKLIRLGSQQAAGSRKIFYATPSTWSSIQSQLVANSYSSADLTNIQTAINAGGSVLLPQKGNIALNQWAGAGYVTKVTTGSTTSTSMKISANLNGGFASIVPSSISASYVSNFTNSNPIRVNTTPITITPTYSFDPIDMSSGNYVFPATDLEVGAPAPRGFTFSRQYHGGRRGVNPAGLGYGWTHNWQVRATRRSAYEQALGLSGTPYDLANALLATTVILDLATVAPDAQHLTLESMIANWMTDQLQDNAVGISIGERSLQFVKRADGVWQPPGGVTMSLVTSGSGWQAQERLGNNYNFDSTGHLTSIVDLWGKTLNVTYNASDLVATVTDAYQRSLTFNYSGTQLNNVTDSTGRSVVFTYNGSDLATASDPEGKADRFTYDTEHRITQVRNHDNQLLAINNYDSAGRVTSQLSQGDATKTWKYFYSLNNTVEQNPLGGQTTYYFDSRKRQTSVQDAIGRVSTTTYDGQDRVTQTSTPLGRTTPRAYDRYHNLTSVIDPDQKQTFYDYDSQQRLWRVRDPLTHATMTVNSFNAQHQPLTITNGEGEQTVNTYNPTGTLASTTPPGAPSATTFAYNSRDELTTTNLPGGGSEIVTRNIYGDPSSVQDARANSTGYTYNLRRQVLTVTRPGQPASVNTYDNQRHLATATDARGKTTSYSYSPTGKLLVTTLPGGATITDTYDLRDWRASTTTPKLAGESAKTTTFYYADSGELLYQYDPLNRITYFGYDGDSRRTLVGDALGHEVGTGYNGRSLVNSTTDPLTHQSTYDYDDAGRRTGFHNRNQHLFTLSYDRADRLLSTTTPNSRANSQNYNNRGLVGTITEPSTQQTTLAYDARGRVSTRADGTGTITYGYDNNSNVLTVQQGTATITRTYDSLNRVSTYDDGRGHALGYGYDNNGNLSSVTYETGKTVTYAYDDRNRLTDITDWTGRHTVLAYDGAGRLVSMTRPNGTVRTNTWDDAGQLKEVKDERTANGVPVMALKISYDLAGRLTDKFEVPAGAAHAPLPARSATYNNDNQLTAFNGLNITSDADGNITSAPAPNTISPLASYIWNTRNQLTSSPGGLTYNYDADGLRTSYTQSEQTTNFVNDPHGPMSRVLWRVRPDGTRTFYIYGPILLYEIEESASGGNPANAARYYHYDHLGSTIALSNDAGKATARAYYSAYGITIQTSGTLNTPFLWQGAFGVQTDPNGLHHMRARYYHAYLGRFLSEDSLGLSAGPNVYAYANGNPVMANDPNGEFVQFIVGAAIGVGVQATIDIIRGQRSSLGTYIGAAAGGALTGGVSSIVSGVGTAVVAGAIGSAGGNLVRQGTDIALGNQQSFSTSSLAFETAAGGVLGGVGQRVLPSALSTLSNQTKGTIGEGISLVNNLAQGSVPIGRQVEQELLGGTRKTIVDWEFQNVFSGATTYVESKFGTAGLTSAQRIARDTLDNYSVEKWTYGFFGQAGAAGGGIIGAASGRALK